MIDHPYPRLYHVLQHPAYLVLMVVGLCQAVMPVVLTSNVQMLLKSLVQVLLKSLVQVLLKSLVQVLVHGDSLDVSMSDILDRFKMLSRRGHDVVDGGADALSTDVDEAEVAVAPASDWVAVAVVIFGVVALRGDSAGRVQGWCQWVAPPFPQHRPRGTATRLARSTTCWQLTRRVVTSLTPNLASSLVESCGKYPQTWSLGQSEWPLQSRDFGETSAPLQICSKFNACTSNRCKARHWLRSFLYPEKTKLNSAFNAVPRSANCSVPKINRRKCFSGGISLKRRQELCSYCELPQFWLSRHHLHRASFKNVCIHALACTL